MRITALIAFTLAITTLLTSGAEAEKRVALVIGNSSYNSISPLDNPKNDAALIADALRAVGFDVVMSTDADRRVMSRSIRQFGIKLRAAGKNAVGLFYFAGHGVQTGGTNYLLPIGAIIEDEADLEIEALSITTVLAQLAAAKNRLNLVILDACRNNPFKTEVRSPTRGLARVSAASGSLIAFSAAPGQVAVDGKGKNSPYTAALAESLRVEGLTVEQVFKRVRVIVEKQTRGKQTPWEESSLRGEFYFKPKAVQGSDRQIELAYWNTIRRSNDIRLFEAYLKQYPKGSFASLASAIIERLRASDSKRQIQKARNSNNWNPSGKRKNQNKTGTKRADDFAYWDTVKNSKDPTVIRSYIDRFPNGTFVGIARDRIERLSSTEQTQPKKKQAATISHNAVTAPKLTHEAPTNLVSRIQTALTRLGCKPGPIDGKWGLKSQKALERFEHFAELTIAGEAVSTNTLRVLQSEEQAVCRNICGVRQVEKNGRCVTKSCSPGEFVNNAGVCEGKLQHRIAADKPPSIRHTAGNSDRAVKPKPVIGKYSTPCRLGQDFSLKPSNKVGKELSRFVGVYNGRWAGKLAHTLIIQEVKNGGTANGFYAWGKYKRWQIFAPGCVRFIGKIVNGKLTAKLPNGAKVTYWFGKTKRLHGTFLLGGRTTRGQFKKQ